MKNFITLLSFILILALAGCSDDNIPVKQDDKLPKVKIFHVDSNANKTIFKEIIFNEKSFSFPAENYFYYGKNIYALPDLFDFMQDYYNFFSDGFGLIKSITYYLDDKKYSGYELIYNPDGTLSSVKEYFFGMTFIGNYNFTYNANKKPKLVDIYDDTGLLCYQYEFFYGKNNFINKEEIRGEDLCKIYTYMQDSSGYLGRENIFDAIALLDIGYSLYYYNSDGKRIKEEIYYDDGKIIWEFQYNAAGKLSVVLVSFKDGVHKKRTYLYNDNGLWIEQIDYDDNNEIREHYVVEYE